MREPSPVETLVELRKAIDAALAARRVYLMADTQYRADGTRIQSVHLENFVVVRYYGKADLVPEDQQ